MDSQVHSKLMVRREAEGKESPAFRALFKRQYADIDSRRTIVIFCNLILEFLVSISGDDTEDSSDTRVANEGSAPKPFEPVDVNAKRIFLMEDQGRNELTLREVMNN